MKFLSFILAILLFCNLKAISNGNPFEPISNVQNQDLPNKVLYYPNPAKDFINIQFPEVGTYKVNIFNLVGEKVIEEFIIQNNQKKIDLSILRKGMYFISFEENGKIVTKTFSKID